MKHIPELTGARFLMAFIVIAYHFNANFNFIPNSYNNFFGTLTRFAVSFFFILSGFILTYVYLNSLSRINLANFFWSRFSRVFPVFFAVMLLMVPIRLTFILTSPENAILTYGLSLHDPVLIFSWLANLFLVAIFIPILNPWLHFWNPPAWALTAEIVFYLIFPFSIFCLRKINQKTIIILGFSFYALLLILTLILYSIVMLINTEELPQWFTTSLYPGKRIFSQDGIQGLTLTYLVYLLPFLRSLEFLIGCVVGCSFLNFQKQKKLPGFLARNLLFIISVLLFYLAYTTSTLRGNLMGLQIYAIYIPSICLGIFAIGSGKTIISSILANPVIIFLGKSSYALYISHFAIMAIHQNLAHIGISFSKYYYLFFVGISLLFGVLLYYFVESPSREFLKKIGKFNSN